MRQSPSSPFRGVTTVAVLAVSAVLDRFGLAVLVVAEILVVVPMALIEGDEGVVAGRGADLGV